MDKYNFSPTSEISDFSESDVSSLSSFFNGGKNRNRDRNSKKSSNVVSKKKSKFPPNMNRWLAWSLVSVSTIWILSSEIKDRGMFRSLLRWFQNKPLSQSKVAVDKIEKILKTMIDKNLRLNDSEVGFPDSKNFESLKYGNIYAEPYEHRVEIKDIDMEYKRFYYNVPFMKQLRGAITVDQLMKDDIIKYYQKICKLIINFKNGVDDSNKDKVKKAIRDKLKFKFSTQMKQVKNADLLKNNYESSPHLGENKTNHKEYDLPNNFINVSPLNHKHKLFHHGSDTKPKIYPENKAHELINKITPITITNAKTISVANAHTGIAANTPGIAKIAKSALGGYFKVSRDGDNIINPVNLHHNASFTGGTFVNANGEDYDIEGEENAKITKDNMQMDILLSLWNNMINKSGNLFNDEIDDVKSISNIETPLLSYLQSYSATCEGELERFHSEYNKVGITKCLHFVLTLKPDFTDVIEHLKTEKINLVLPESKEMNNNIAIKIISSVYEDLNQFKNDPNSARIHNSISFHHPNTIGNFMKNNANSRKAFVIPQSPSAEMAEALDTTRAKHMENFNDPGNNGALIETGKHPGEDRGNVANNNAKQAQDYIRAYYQAPPDTLWSKDLKDKVPEKYTEQLTEAYRFLEDLVNTGTKGSLMVSKVDDPADTQVNSYVTANRLENNNNLSLVMGDKNGRNDNHLDIWTESYGLTNVPLRGNLLRSTNGENAPQNNTSQKSTLPAVISITGEELSRIQAGHFDQDYTGGVANALSERVAGMLDGMTTHANKTNAENAKYTTLYKYGQTGDTVNHKILRQYLLSTNDNAGGNRQSVIRAYERLYERIYFMCGNSITFMDGHEHTLHPADVFAVGSQRATANPPDPADPIMDPAHNDHQNYLQKNPIQKASGELKIHPSDITRDYDLRNFIRTSGIHRFRLLNNNDYDQQIAMVQEGATTNNISSKSEKIKEKQKLLDDFLKSEVKYGEFKISP